MVFDAHLRRLTSVDLSPAGQKLGAAERPIVTLRAEATPTQALWENDSTILAPGFFRAGRLGVFDWSGNFLRAYDPGQAVFQIDVNPSGRRLYALVHEPDVGVVVFGVTAGGYHNPRSVDRSPR